MREYMGEETLQEMARSMTASIVEIPTNKSEFRRETTAKEKEIMYKLAFGALLELNSIGGHAMNNPAELDMLYKMEETVIGAAEYMFRVFLPKRDSYLSFYNPLKVMVNKWSEDAWDIPLERWYRKAYSHDTIHLFMDDEPTFRDLYDAIQKGEDVYDLIDVVDCVVRERLFRALAHICRTDYSEIDQMWKRGKEKC